MLSLGRNLDHGLTLELGVYIAKIQPGSVAAKEGGIAVGDRVINVRFGFYINKSMFLA